MTRREELYTQPEPERSAWFRSAETAPDLIRGGGTQAHYLATGATTGGLYGLYKWEMGPGPGGADPHFHRTFSEAFYILAGTVQLFDGNEWIDGSVGDFVHVPPGGIHAFRNQSGAPASMLIHFAPRGTARGLLQQSRPPVRDVIRSSARPFSSNTTISISSLSLGAKSGLPVAFLFPWRGGRVVEGARLLSEWRVI